MATKRMVRIVGVLCGICLVSGGMQGRIGTAARASDGQLPIPEVHDTWQEQKIRFVPVERTLSKSNNQAAKKAATAEHARDRPRDLREEERSR